MSLLEFHNGLINDHIRTGRYRAAILKTVKRGDVVLDIGTGSGILALFSCQAGAKRVYAVERTEAIEMAKALIRSNGAESKVIFIKKDVRELALKEKVDVVTSELISAFGIGQNMLSILEMARKRFLKEKGKMVPMMVEMHLVPVEHRRFYNKIIFAGHQSKYRVNFSCFRHMASSHLYRNRYQRKDFLASPKKIYTLDPLHRSTQGAIKAASHFIVKRRGILHGFCGFFRASLAPGIWITNDPPIKPVGRENLFFPLEEPVSVKTGDRIHFEYSALESDPYTLWRWKTDVTAVNEKRKTFVKRTFDQNSLFGFPISPENLHGVSEKRSSPLVHVDKNHEVVRV